MAVRAVIWILISIVILAAQPGMCRTGYGGEGKNISLECHEQSLRSVLDNIRVIAGVNFIFQDNLVDNIKITCSIENSSVKNALKKILAGLDISYKEFGVKSFVLYKERKIVKKTSYKAIIVNENTPGLDTVVTFVKPQMISNLSPVYPEEASKNNIEGIVKLKFLVNKEGEVNKTLIQQSSGSKILDSAALDYINKLKFIPAKSNGVARSIWMAMVLKYMVIY